MTTAPQIPSRSDALTLASGPEPAWRPLLSGAAATRAHDVVLQIADGVADRWVPQTMQSSGLCGGAAGCALLFAYLAESLDDARYGELAQRYVDRALELLGDAEAGWALFGGLSGTAFVLDHVAGEPWADGVSDPLDQIDDALERHLRARPDLGCYDLISGLVGFAVYALERRSRPQARESLGLVVERLAAHASLDQDGITWRTAPELLWAPTREQDPDGLFDLGVAHGTPAVAAILAAAAAAGNRTAAQLYPGAVRWVLAQRLGRSSPSAFPYSVRAGRTPEPARSAWCYGDPGVAATLVAAARCVDDAAVLAEALVIARQAAQRPVDSCGVLDGGLCHGAAGLVQLYNRLWQTSGDPVFAAAARGWVDRLFAFQRPGTGVAGFTICRPDPTLGAAEELAVIGALGIGLGLLATVTTTEPAWDRLLVASLAPVR
jgi:lantibiotic biosynthesis protein